MKVSYYLKSVKDIDDFLKKYYSLRYFSGTGRSEAMLKNILLLVEFPFSIIVEAYHVDRSYSDMYYTYYSSKHIMQNRFVERLSLFQGKTTSTSFLDTNQHHKLGKRFIGCLVVHPTTGRIIGRTLLNPEFLKLPSSILVRLSEYEVDIRGVRLNVWAFPYRMQDEEVTTCAEVTLLNLFEYFGHRYEDYRNIYIGELNQIIQRSAIERVLPTHGLSYSAMTKALSETGFAPRLYSGSVYNNRSSTIKNIIYYYVESGIPVGIGMFENQEKISKIGNDSSRAGHSIVCIGHNSDINELDVNKEHRADSSEFYYVNAADCYDSYVVMDDNKIPYSILNFKEASDKEFNILVPLYKRMFLEATDAYSKAKRLVIKSPICFDKIVEGEYKIIGTKSEPLVLRLFMVSSKSYKANKMKLDYKRYDYIKAILFDLPLPRFVWLCELYEKSEYEKGFTNGNPPLACGEILIDATANSVAPRDCILLVHYPEHISYRYPDEGWEEVFNGINDVKIEGWSRFPGFWNNLKLIEGC